MAFNEPIPVIDANVYRVISRLSGIRYPVNNSRSYGLYLKHAAGFMDREHPGEHNQALMELGALICIPSKPYCTLCPLSGFCYAYARGLTDQLPVREKKTIVRNRYFHYFIISDGRYILLNKRVKEDIWKGLYDFPLAETAGPVDPVKIIRGDTWKKIFGENPVHVIRISRPVKHRLTHQLITARFYHIRTAGDVSFRKHGLVSTDKNNFNRYPLPRLIEKYLADFYDKIAASKDGSPDPSFDAALI